MCLESKAFEIETKSIDSAVDLGINGREEHRILCDRQLTCAPLVTDGYQIAVPDAQGRVESWRYYYGPVDAWYPGRHNWTIEISAMPPNVNVTYLTDARDDSMRDTSWLPLDSLSTGNGDVTIIFVQHNNVIHQTANNDPVFRANVSFQGLAAYSGETTYFRPFNRISPMSCTTTHRYCTLGRRSCTAESGYRDSSSEVLSADLDFTPEQRATAIRIMLATWLTNIYDIVVSRPQSALQAQELTRRNYQSALPDNQWEIEVLSWEQINLARLQAYVHDFAAGGDLKPTLSYREPLRRVPHNKASPDRKPTSSGSPCVTARPFGRPETL